MPEERTLKITVKALRPFKEALGSGDLELERPEGETVEGLIHALVEEHPAFRDHALDANGDIDLTLNIMVSGRPVGENDLGVPLKDGDDVLLFMPLSGG